MSVTWVCEVCGATIAVPPGGMEVAAMQCGDCAQGMRTMPAGVTVRRAQGAKLIWTDARSGRRFSELAVLLSDRASAAKAKDREAPSP